MKVSKTGYKKDSEVKNEKSLVVPSGWITMKEDNGEPLKKGPILGIDNLGNMTIMEPGLDYSFPGNYVYEIPVKKGGGHIVPGRYRNPEGNWLNKYAGGGDISIPNLSRGWLEKYAEGSEVPANLPWINSQGQYQEPVKTSKVLSDDDLRRIDISEISETTDTPAIRLAQQLSVQQYKDWQNRKPVAKKPVSKKQNYNARIAEYSRAEDKKVIDAYYKKYDPANEEQVKAIQTELVAKNFLPGPAAIDGKFGDKTKQAYLKYKTAERVGDLSGETEKSTCSYDGCAEYVSSVTRSYGWVLGDAWTMKNNIETNGGTVKYNIYTDPRFSRVKDIGQLKNVTETVKRNNKASADMFEVGDVVGLYNKGSNMHQTALKDGRGTYNTHVGVVTEIKDGKPIISHNIHGKLHHDSYNNLTIGWIGTPAPRIAQYKPSKQPETLKDKINIYSKELTEILAPGVDSEKIANNIKGILRKETGLGRLTPTEADIKEIQVKRFLLGESTDPEDISRGIGKLKTATIPDDMKYFLGINNENVDDDAGIKAAVYKYVDAYNQLKKYSQNNPQLNLTDEDLHQMSILAYNQGTDKLMNLGYNNPSMPISSEVDALRDLYSGNVKDISSTNFKYLPTINTTILGVPVNIDLGQALYNLRYPEGHESYISRVNKYANTPIEELEASMPSKKLGGWLDRYQDGREVAADATAVKVNPLVRAINIDKAPSNFDYQNYYDKADKYLSRDIFKGTTLTAKDIADAANEFYIESNYQYPLDLLLTQAQIESKLGKALKSKHNYFNVGNTDSGATRDFPSAKNSVKDYMTLMYNNYLNKGQKNVEELLKPKGFVNYEGSRYASNPDYENMLSSQMQFINNYLKNHKNGGSAKWLDKYQGDTQSSQVKTYASDPNYFNNHAVFVDNPQANELVRSKVYAGTHGWDPSTNSLVRLNKPVAVPEAIREMSTADYGKKSYKERFESNTPAGKEVRKAAVAQGMRDMVQNPAFYAPGAIAATALAGPTVIPTIGEALSYPAVVGSTALPGVTMGNILGAAGAGYSTQQILDPSSELRTNPNAENILMTGLGFVGTGIGQGLMSGARQTGKYLNTKSQPLKAGLNKFLQSKEGIFAKPYRQGELSYTLSPEEFSRLRQIDEGRSLMAYDNPNKENIIKDFVNKSSLTDSEIEQIFGKSRFDILKPAENAAEPEIVLHNGTINLTRPSSYLPDEGYISGSYAEQRAAEAPGAAGAAQRAVEAVAAARRQQRAAGAAEALPPPPVEQHDIIGITSGIDYNIPAYQRRNIDISSNSEQFRRIQLELEEIVNNRELYDPVLVERAQSILKSRTSLSDISKSLRRLFQNPIEQSYHSAVPSLTAHSFKNKREMLETVKKKIEDNIIDSPIGSVITGSTNTSYNSYLPQIDFVFKNAGTQGLSKPVFLGYHPMNNAGFLSDGFATNDEILKFINSSLNKIQKRSKANLNLGTYPPYITKSGELMLPQYGVKKLNNSFTTIKKKHGGSTKWLDEYEKGGVNSQGMGYFDYINGYRGVSS